MGPDHEAESGGKPVSPETKVLYGDAWDLAQGLEPGSIDCICTSPPYWGLRSYLPDGHGDKALEFGLEATPQEYVAKLVDLFARLRPALKDCGTLWLNLGDSYASQGRAKTEACYASAGTGNSSNRDLKVGARVAPPGLKPKDLCMIPAQVALALQAPHYTGFIKAERERVWLAAMMDGEGCLFISRSKTGATTGRDRKYVRTQDAFDVGVKVTNTNRAIVEECARIVGYGSVRVSRTRDRDAWEWASYSHNARAVVREVYPYLIAKRHEARLLLGCPPSGDDGTAAHEALKLLHGGSDVTVDYPAPPSLYAPGWWLRSDIIWSKPNPMPESVTDRPTKAHEYIFLLAKSERYYFDQDAVREPDSGQQHHRNVLNGAPSLEPSGGLRSPHGSLWGTPDSNGNGHNIRTVWSIATKPYAAAHFATFPPEIPERCIKAGTSERGVCPECGKPWERMVERVGKSSREWQAERGPGTKGNDTRMGQQEKCIAGGRPPDPSYVTIGWQPTCDHDAEPIPATVLDPFAGSGTTLEVARKLGRNSVGFELNEDYRALIEDRLKQQVLL